jgi:hypothetical protein
MQINLLESFVSLSLKNKITRVKSILKNFLANNKFVNFFKFCRLKNVEIFAELIASS